MASKVPEPVALFYSYSHVDEGLRSELEKHLSILRRQGVIADWHDRKIIAGTEWAGQIDNYLKSAGIILLLISTDFLASEYCYDIELKCALERHNRGEARVIPVILRPAEWTGAEFGKLQALPKDARPVVRWENQDEAFADIAKGIRAAVDDLTKSGRNKATENVPDLLKKFRIRPKKYAGREFIADIGLCDGISGVSETTSECLSLSLGDAIQRKFKLDGEKLSQSLFAEGKVADWLEDAASGTYRVRIRLLFGTYYYETQYPDEYGRLASKIGYQLIEVIPDTNEERVPGKSP